MRVPGVHISYGSLSLEGEQRGKRIHVRWNRHKTLGRRLSAAYDLPNCHDHHVTITACYLGHVLFSWSSSSVPAAINSRFPPSALTSSLTHPELAWKTTASSSAPPYLDYPAFAAQIYIYSHLWSSLFQRICSSLYVRTAK